MSWSVELLGTSPGRGHGNPLQYLGFPSGSDSKEPVCNAGYLGWEDPLEKEMASHSSIVAWRIPWTKESGRLQSVRSHRAGHD